ncbi:cytochrome C [Geomonas sp. RF6]|uniref:cytochrome C n=1 Tax=Geomonas sp. RF6 TaxID=2897342 RepID=UPI001E547F88|nr:cytochrome C [Geomonas sp. RF6]UFS70529.1 cytochrome C [Geomonas sp. RF6]
MTGKGFSKIARSCVLAVALICAAGSAFAGRIATVDIPAKPELYATTPAPLSAAQCAQCHTGVFGDLKASGGKHQFECQGCHKVLHAYNPKKANYDAIMPKCSSCHTDIHGAANKDCASCHTNPHAPCKVGMTSRLTSACASCHANPKADLVKFPSKHTALACEFCHKSHGYKPACSECHKGHYKGQDFATCVKCHSVHKPKQVTYGTAEPAASCGACHGKVFNKWKGSASRHAKVNCAQCHHTKHKYIPQCQECHPTPHPKTILDRFPKCLGCHLDVHDPPNMKK